MITLSKIAKIAHVSVSTVSKAFSMSHDVNADTREMIFEIAKQYGCFTKYYRAKYPKTVIAVICPEFKSMLYSGALSYLQQYLSEKNCEMQVTSTDFSQKSQEELLRYYNQYVTVDGVIIIGGKTEIDPSLEIPVATIFSENINNCIISVTNNYTPALEEAVDYFLSKGIKDLGFIGETRATRKLSIFKTIIQKKLGTINEKNIRITDERFELGGYKAAEKLIKERNLPKALVCAYDYMAIGAIRCLCDNGYKVPDDVLVMGMDDLDESQFLNPPLTSVNSNISKACKITADALIGFFSGEIPQKTAVVDTKIHFRKSTQI